MKKPRTGLLIEAAEFVENADKNNIPSATVKEYPSCKVTTVDITTDVEAKALDREKGRYITIEFDKTYNINDSEFESVVDVIAKNIRWFTDEYRGKRIVVVGIGNRNITADSIGPKSIDRIIVTRGLENTEYISRQCFGNVCAFCANVFGVTGIESAELIEGVAKTLTPALIIVVDALATVSLKRLCKTVQISNSALTPGGGVDNARKSISTENVDTPVVSIGIPTVIDTVVFVESDDILGDYAGSLVSMPARIDDATDAGAKLIAFALNKALHNSISTDDILKFLY